MSIETHFKTLRDETIHFLESRAIAHPNLAKIITTVIDELHKAKLPNPLPKPNRLPGVRHLPTALAMSQAEPMADLANAFAQFEPNMCWIRTEHYRKTLGEDYFANYGYINLLGYDAFIPHDTIIVAFFLIGPGQHYPRHHHEAEEIYFPFGGDTLWGQNDAQPTLRPAGEPIHNTPWLPHEMMTQEMPLFALVVWVSEEKVRLAELME